MGYIFLEEIDLIMINAQDKKTFAYTKDRCEPIIVTGSLKYFEKKLSKNTFFRCHYSYIINLWHIMELNFKNSNIILTGNMVVPVSRGQMYVFKEMLKENMKIQNQPQLKSIDKHDLLYTN